MAVVTLDKTVFVGTNACRGLKSLFKKHNWSNCFIICDTNTLTNCLSQLILTCPSLKDAEIIELEPGEESKDINVITSIWQTLTELEADKKSLIINLGGGVVSDIGSFAASTFKRGIDFINIPTSLLSMADASIGGKNGINFNGVKNTIGTIIQPNYVFVDPTFLKTLPENHLVNGYAEILKIALISDKGFFNAISKTQITDSFGDEKIILKSIRLKSQVVKKDPYDKGLRKILNFGHTIGHALESLSIEKDHPLLHGEAVAVGMAIESYMSLLLKRITAKDFDLILQSLCRNFHFPKIDERNFNSLFKYIDQDKKNTKQQYMPALLNGIGKCDPAVKVSRTKVEKAILYYNKNIANEASL